MDIVNARDKKPWIVNAVNAEMTEEFAAPLLKNDYIFVHWSDFMQDPDPYYTDIQAMIVSPVYCPVFTDELLSKMINLKVVSSAGVGVDHLDVELLKRHGVRIGYTPHVVTQTTADMGLTLMMTIGRRIPEMMETARGYEAGAKLDVQRAQRCRGQDIFEATLGIVGLGNIGFEVAKRAKGFRMNILYYNRNRRSKEDEDAINATYCSTLEALLPQVDYLMLIVPLTESTRHMIQMEQFKMMKPTSFIINIARGGLIKTNDLVGALQSGTIAGAALDVTDPEPLPKEHPLLNMPNVIVTPHAGVFTQGGLSRIYGLAVQNLKAALEGWEMPAELQTV